MTSIIPLNCSFQSYTPLNQDQFIFRFFVCVELRAWWSERDSQDAGTDFLLNEEQITESLRNISHFEAEEILVVVEGSLYFCMLCN